MLGTRGQPAGRAGWLARRGFEGRVAHGARGKYLHGGRERRPLRRAREQRQQQDAVELLHRVHGDEDGRRDLPRRRRGYQIAPAIFAARVAARGQPAWSGLELGFGLGLWSGLGPGLGLGLGVPPRLPSSFCNVIFSASMSIELSFSASPRSTPLSSHVLRRGLCRQSERSLSLVKTIATVSEWVRVETRARG